MALDMIHQSSNHQFLFLSDSLSCLQSLRNRDLSHPLIADILCRVHVLLERGAKVAFMWVPSHVRLAGNSAADIGLSLQKQLYTPTNNKSTCSFFGFLFSHTFPLTETMARKLEFWNIEQAPRHWAESERF